MHKHRAQQTPRLSAQRERVKVGACKQQYQEIVRIGKRQRPLPPGQHGKHQDVGNDKTCNDREPLHSLRYIGRMLQRGKAL